MGIEGQNASKRYSSNKSYFNNHYGAQAVLSALQFKEVLGQKLTVDQEKALTHSQNYRIYPSDAIEHM
jgi:uncharacterized protein YecE (DUF72 family)